MPDFISIIDHLTYKSYEFNRLENPEIVYTKWASIYPNIEVLEQKFKEKKTLEKQNDFTNN